MMPAIAELRQFAKRYTVAWCSHQAASVAGFYAQNGTLRINDGAAAEGRGAIAEAAQGFMTAFPDLRVLMDDVVLRGDGAEYQWTLVGTNTGSGGTGQRVRISGFEMWKIGEDGLIAESEGHFDAADYQRQLEHGVEGSK
jgi:predicted ester cyclase